MQTIGLCRFAYPALGGFQIKHETPQERAAFLYQPARLEERFRLMESVALPSLQAQTDDDFDLVIVIGDDLPSEHIERLTALIARMPQARIEAHPPRPQREVMKEILNKARRSIKEPCLQFRFDDDDAVAVDFVEKLRDAEVDCRGLTRHHRTTAFDFNMGYVAEFGSDGVRAAQTHRAYYTAAMGMYVRGGCRMTIMNFSHGKIARFMPTVTFSDPDMWVRSHNGFNDSRQAASHSPALQLLDDAQSRLFRERFAIDVTDVRDAFSEPGALGVE